MLCLFENRNLFIQMSRNFSMKSVLLLCKAHFCCGFLLTELQQSHFVSLQSMFLCELIISISCENENNILSIKNIYILKPTGTCLRCHLPKKLVVRSVLDFLSLLQNPERNNGLFSMDTPMVAMHAVCEE